MKYILPLYALAFPATALYAQAASRVMNAKHLDGQITINGRLTEPEWQNADKASDLVQLLPNPGLPSAQRTVVSILYNDDAVYIGAMMYDTSPDSVLHQLSSRDDYENTNTDAFGISFDPYLDRQNATQFVVTAAGVQTDAILKFDNVDKSWNSAWYSRVVRNDSGWCVEMKIPYTALRFPKTDVQHWGVNFFRVIRRSRERSYWNTVVPTISNVVTQEGTLNGIHNVVAPIRLALLPYLSAYAEHYNGVNANSINGGMDIKYGLSESFTLDMTLVPDFGQTLYDNKVLNLSPVEVRYDERRYFFTEGVDLFNKNDLFYSRRVGGTPVNSGLPAAMLTTSEVVDKNPITTKLYNATKISGRTKRKLGIGFFNAVAAPSSATVRDTITGGERNVQTAPLTNYNVMVLDQALKNNSYISLVNTNVTRKENSYNANVSALLFRFADKNNRYAIDGSGDMSRIYGSANPTDVGYRYALSAGKSSGNYMNSLSIKTISDRFNPNDLGYLDRNNTIVASFGNIYNTYKPFGNVNATYQNIYINYYRVYNPDAFVRLDINGSHSVTFKDFLSAGVYWDAQPLKTNDYYEPRKLGRYYILPENYQAGGFISSDYRKRFALDVEVNNRWFSLHPRNALYASVSPRFRFNDKLSAVYRAEMQDNASDVGFVNNINDSIYLGTRNLRTITNTLSMAYIFTGTMSLKLDARHYWSQARYLNYDLLNADGTLQYNGYTINHDINYNSFNAFLNFIWQFKPGSEMSMVYQNSIYSSGQNIITNYFTDVNHTLQAPQSNSLSIKMIYYLDYQSVESSLRRRRRLG